MRQITKDIEMSIDQQNSLTRFFANGFIDKLELVSCRASVSESSALWQESDTVPAKPVMIYCMCNRLCLWFQSGRR